MIYFVFLFVTIFVSPIDSWAIFLRGRLIFNEIPLQSNLFGQVKLIEISSSRVVTTTRLVRPQGSPIYFVLKFSPEKIDPTKSYIVQATIGDFQSSTNYENEFVTSVIPRGDDRTMFVDLTMKKSRPVTKTRWPEFVGMNGDEAAELIKNEFGSSRIKVQIVRQGSPMTLDFNPNRVRVVVDSNGLVASIPFIA